MKRECGPCTACCTAMGVPELSKAPGTTCSSVCATGCGVYKTRPQSCRDFQCVWLQGALEDEHRPDKTGVVLVPAGPNSKFEEKTGVQLLTAFESWPGAFERDPAKRLLGHLATKLAIVMVKGPSRTVIGPPDTLKKVNEFINVRRGD